MIVHLRTEGENVQESENVLRFALQAKAIKVQPVQNINMHAVKKLEEEKLGGSWQSQSIAA